MIEAIASPGNGPPPHLHKNKDETLYVLEGDFEILNGDKGLLKAKPGAVAFVPKGTIHRFRCTGDRTGRLLFVYTPGGMKGSFGNQVGLLLEMAQHHHWIQKRSLAVK
jgi:quercetin dioxygenase-like cupin family protein